ncbi:hypothetical protein ABTD75_18625, partial [Acinetobacter baumannii]
AYAADKPALKKIVYQIANVEQVRFLGLDPVNGIGFNVTRTDNLYHNLTIEQLKDKLVSASRDSSPWIGMPEAGIADLPGGQAVLLR